ncbi:SUKH-4 family immunity protein [Streptomyces sp. NPDC053427]|uniref:SUKH-4 family immunity protein n=1 Tax=Streptomyces sp. NPDC053427 TaxID=3365701 RepID=UPI0037D119D7
MNTSELLAIAQSPTIEWLESCFGPGTLWRPGPAALPAGLQDKETRAFLTETGIPAVQLHALSYDSADLPERGMWEADPDELFGNRYPDDHSPPTRYSYCIGKLSQLHLMVSGNTGAVEIYNPDGWDHAAGYGGYAAPSVPEFIGALGLFTLYQQRFDDADVSAAFAALDEFTTLLEQLGQGPDESGFWEDLLEEIREECEYRDD